MFLYYGGTCPWGSNVENYICAHGFDFKLNLTPALDPLTIDFALEVRCDPQFSGVPEAIHFSGEVFSELG